MPFCGRSVFYCVGIHILSVYRLTGIWLSPPFCAMMSDIPVNAHMHRVFFWGGGEIPYPSDSLGRAPSSRIAPPWANSVWDYLENSRLFAKVAAPLCSVVHV